MFLSSTDLDTFILSGEKFKPFVLQVCLFFWMVSCQQDSEDNILETQNMFIHNLVHAIAHHLARDLCSFIVFNATIDTLTLKYFLSLVFVLKAVFCFNVPHSTAF